jgi:hypothetical protein
LFLYSFVRYLSQNFHIFRFAKFRKIFIYFVSRNFAKFSYISFREISRKSFENFAKCEMKISRNISRNFFSRNFAGHPTWNLSPQVTNSSFSPFPLHCAHRFPHSLYHTFKHIAKPQHVLLGLFLIFHT